MTKQKTQTKARIFIAALIVAIIMLVPSAAFAESDAVSESASGLGSSSETSSSDTSGSNSAADSPSIDSEASVSDSDQNSAGQSSGDSSDQEDYSAGETGLAQEDTASFLTDDSAAETSPENAAAEAVEEVAAPEPSGSAEVSAVQSTADNDDADAIKAGAESDATGNSYIVTITPDGVVQDEGEIRHIQNLDPAYDGPRAGDQNVEFTITFTELGDKTKLGSAKVEVPDDFEVNEGSLNVGASDGKIWWGNYNNSYIYLWADSENDYLGQGEWVSATFTANIANDIERGIYIFATDAWQEANNAFNGIYDGADSGMVNNMATGYNDPVVIVGQSVSTREELEAIAGDLDDCYVQTAHIDLDGQDSEPIGDSNSPFNGAYNGNGFIIDGLTIYKIQDDDYLGLFAKTGSAAYIINVSLDNVSIDGTSTHNYVGGLVGFNAGTVTNCSVNIVNSLSVKGNNYVGGLVGYNEAGTITGCYVTGPVDGNTYVGGLVGLNSSSAITDSRAEGAVSGNNQVGGLVGYNLTGTITGSYATGNVNGTENYVGGLVGNNWSGSIITDSWAEGTVNGHDEVGGLTGRNNRSTITGSYATGAVTGNQKVGGLAGQNLEGSITGSYATGSVIGAREVGGLVGLNDSFTTISTITDSWAEGAVNGDTYVGGLVGRNDNQSTIVDSWAEGAVTGNTTFGGLVGLNLGSTIISSFATGNVTGGQTANILGGLVGHNWDSTIMNCYATGAVTGNNEAGGLVGRNEDGFITDSWAEGAVTGNNFVGGLAGLSVSSAITGSYATGNVTGNDYAGGLVGDSWDSAITGCHAIGSVTGTGDYLGGLIGNNATGSTITNSYATGAVNGGIGDYLGGLAGSNEGAIESSFATGPVDGGVDSYIGGLVGINDSDGTISNSYATGSVNGDHHLGGLVGLNRGTVEYCYATGLVTGYNHLGGLVGRNDGGSVTNSYYDSQTSGQDDDSGKGQPKLTAEMQGIATFSGWDIVSIGDFNPDARPGDPDFHLWYIDQNNDYPRLWWQYVEQADPSEPAVGSPTSSRSRGSFLMPISSGLVAASSFTSGQETTALVFKAADGSAPLVTAAFVKTGTAFDLARAITLYLILLQEFEEHRDSMTEQEYAVAAIELAVAWAAIHALDLRLLAEMGRGVVLATALDAYRSAVELVSSHGSYLTSSQMGAVNAILNAVADILRGLGAEV